MKALCYSKPLQQKIKSQSSLHPLDVNFSFKTTLVSTKPDRTPHHRHALLPSTHTKRYLTLTYATSPLIITAIQTIDDTLSKRPIPLDDCYFIIYIDRTTHHIVAEYYTNLVDSDGLAIDPETKQVIPCGSKRPPTQRYRGKTAKELSVLIIETDHKVTRADHANYLGREFQKAEFSMLYPSLYDYIQD